MLLGCPWIHTVGAIPSSLHQKVKFIKGDKLLLSLQKTKLQIRSYSVFPFVGTQDIREESQCHAFKFV